MMFKPAFRFRFWPAGILIGFAAFVAVNLAFVTVAFRHKPELVSDHYYSEGSNLRQIAERKAASDATGWTVRIRCLPVSDSDKPLVELNVAQSNGLPCDSLIGTAAFYRPSSKALDIAAIPMRFVGTGRYLVVLPRRLERGAWQVIAHLARHDQQSDVRLNLFSEE
jgi:nitrogen fixation protein FixH